jgi:hypothetical protein
VAARVRIVRLADWLGGAVENFLTAAKGKMSRGSSMNEPSGTLLYAGVYRGV